MAYRSGKWWPVFSLATEHCNFAGAGAASLPVRAHTRIRYSIVRRDRARAASADSAIYRPDQPGTRRRQISGYCKFFFLNKKHHITTTTRHNNNISCYTSRLYHYNIIKEHPRQSAVFNANNNIIHPVSVSIYLYYYV